MISKKKFIKYMNRLRELNQEMDKINSACKNSNFLSLDISCGEYEGLILNILKEVFQDKNEWIDYYAYELEFGAIWKEGIITDKDGTDIPLKNEEDLWKLLMDNHKF